MDPDPAKRFQSAKEFLAPIQRVLAVIDRAVEEREARRSQPPSDALVGVLTSPQRPSAFARPRPTTTVMEQPVLSPKPPAPPKSTALLDTSAQVPEERDSHRVPTRPQRVARPQLTEAEAQPAAQTPAAHTPRGEPEREVAMSRKGTLLMHAAPPVAMPAPAERPAPARPENHRMTRALGAVMNEAPHRRSTSTIPPPA